MQGTSDRSVVVNRARRNKETGCLEWTGAVVDQGYGLICLRDKRGAKKRLLVHRLIFSLCVGKIKSGLYVCHKCDNPACIEPEHLFLGTHGDNMKDMHSKKRHFIKNGRKLTARKVRNARREFGLGTVTKAALAKKYGVSGTTMGNVINMKMWKHVGDL